MKKAQYKEPSEYRRFNGERYHRVYEAPRKRQGEVRKAAEKMRKDGALVRVVLLQDVCVAYARTPTKLRSRRAKQKKDMRGFGVEGWGIDIHGNEVILWRHRINRNKSVMVAKTSVGRDNKVGYNLTTSPGNRTQLFSGAGCQNRALAAAKLHMENRR